MRQQVVIQNISAFRTDGPPPHSGESKLRRARTPALVSSTRMEPEVKASIAIPASLWKEVRKAAIDADVDVKVWVRQALEAQLKKNKR